jgi:hypothetical protein
MTFADIMAVLKFFPTMVELAKQIAGWVAAGLTEAQILSAYRAIDKSFILADPKERAKKLNDIFRNE